MARRARRRAKRVKGALDSRVTHARHEAAHAVVAFRLGLPLLFTHIEADSAPMRTKAQMGTLPVGATRWQSFGFTTLVEGTVDKWVALLPREDARVKLEGFAAMGAAGIVAEVSLGNTPQDPGCRDDIVSLVEAANALGIGNSNEMPEVRDFMAEAYGRAKSILLDNEAGWDQVGRALFLKGRLSGEEVAEIMALVQREENDNV